MFETKVKCDLIKIDFLLPFVSTSSYTHFELKSLKTQLLNSLSLHYRLTEQIGKSEKKKKKSKNPYCSKLLVYLIVFHWFDMILLVLHIFILHLSNSYTAGSPFFSNCTDTSCDLPDSLWMSTVQACTAELVITDFYCQ